MLDYNNDTIEIKFNDGKTSKRYKDLYILLKCLHCLKSCCLYKDRKKLDISQELAN